ncbi:MAG: AraC family transcriptional regulator [Cyclobacteriaceae bacterium]
MLIAIYSALVLVGLYFFYQRGNAVKADPALNKKDVAELEMIYQKVLGRLQDEKYYLNKNVKLSDLADEIGIKERQVSRSINTFEKRNFNSLVNLYRIRHAQEMIDSGEFSHYTIEAIADESGFSNKVSFYNSFKSEVGMSPSQYRALKQP